MKGDFWSSALRVLPVLKASLTCSNWEWIPASTIRCAIVLHDDGIVANKYVNFSVYVSIGYIKLINMGTQFKYRIEFLPKILAS